MTIKKGGGVEKDEKKAVTEATETGNRGIKAQKALEVPKIVEELCYNWIIIHHFEIKNNI